MNKRRYTAPELEIISLDQPLQILAGSTKDPAIHDATGGTTGTGSDYGFYDPNNPEAGENESADSKRRGGGLIQWED